MAVDVHALNRRYQSLRDERSPWDSAYADLALHFSPTKYRSDASSDTPRNPQILNSRLVDSTGVLDMRTLAAGMQGGMTSPARPWFKLTLQDEEALSAPDAGKWLDDVTRRMQSVLHRSNFYNAAHALYSDLGTFGTGLMIEVADWDGLHFFVVNAGEYVIDTNEMNVVDTFFRRINMTARQIIQEFGEEKVPNIVKTAAKYKTGNASTTRFDVIQAVYPRKDRTYGKMTSSNMPFASVYWMLAGTDGQGAPHVLRESGFDEFPAFAPRWDVSGNDVYGRSPAMDVLPDCRMLQSMTTTLLKTLHKNADPPMSVMASLKSVGLDLRPGGENFVDTFDGRPPTAAQPIQQPNAQSIQYTQAAIQDVRQKLHDGLYADLFKMLISNDRRQITATEIEAREQEKMILIGPVVERLQKEFFEPLIQRTFNLMRRYDFIPEPPESISGAPLRIEFVSVLAQAQRLVSTSGIDQFMAFALNMSQAFPQVMDVIDVEYTISDYAEAVGAPKGMLRSSEEIAAIQQAQAEAQQQAAQQQQAMAAAQQVQNLTGAAKNLGQATVGADGQTALEAIIGGMGGL